MPKVNGSLADIETEFKPPAPGRYRFKVKEVDWTSKVENGNKRDSVSIEAAINEAGNEENGKVVFTNCHLMKKDGTPNKAGLAELKRFGIAIVGEERTNSSDFDTDELKGGDFEAEVYHEQYQDKNDKPAIAARIDTRTIQAV